MIKLFHSALNLLDADKMFNKLSFVKEPTYTTCTNLSLKLWNFHKRKRFIKCCKRNYETYKAIIKSNQKGGNIYGKK